MCDKDFAKRDQLYRMTRAAILDDWAQCSNLSALIEQRYSPVNVDMAESELMQRFIKPRLNLRAQLDFEMMEAIYTYEAKAKAATGDRP